jgi:hypothetical protein
VPGKELVGNTVQDKLPWVKGNDKEVMRHFMSGIMQQKKVHLKHTMNWKDKQFQIPKDLS